MDPFLQYFYTSLPFIVVLTMAAVLVVGMGLGLIWPRLLVYPYLGIFFLMNSTNYGSLAMYATPGVYSRGSGLLFFPLVLWYMLGAWCCARVAAS
ncbi:MAG TPA: O-antigen ligase domain-containing protein, partial [Telluria sp.]|nr:O-antigen ligase domain-containing protein [Telluria sp.]